MRYDTNIIDSKDDIELSDIRALEQMYGFKFPEDVVAHYLQYNGGYPEKSLFIKNEDEYVVNYFIPVKNDEIDGMSLGETLRIVSDILPKGLVPFADDESGNLFCFSARPDDFGTIYYFDHEFDYGENPSDHIDYLSESIISFINSLAIYDEDDY